MKAPFSALTQSQFFHSAFNSAIFDGPVRIYFVQFHETFALKIYFALQDKLSPLFNAVKDYSKNSNSTVLIMIYPSEDVFLNSFPHFRREEISEHIGIDTWEGERVIGLVAEHSDRLIPKILNEVRESFQNWTLNKIAKLDFEESKLKDYSELDENPS